MRLLLLAAAALLAHAQEIMPARPTPADYKAQATVGTALLAADFLGRTVPAANAFILKDYVVIEVAYFSREFVFNNGQFSLRLNRKQALLAQTPGMVAGSLKYGDWENSRGVEVAGSMGNAGVILGRNTQSRFPGDRRVPTPPNGTPAKTKEVENGSEPWDWVEKLAWADGPGKGPSAGLLYFPYRGNLAKLETIELICNGPDGMATLVLRGSGASPAKSTAPTRKP